MSTLKHHGSIKSYTAGFLVSIILTLIAYIIVAKDYFDGWRLAFILLELAIFQLWIQVVFFLHLGRDAKVRWNVLAFLYMILIVLIIGIGSIWIMNNLQYSHKNHDSHMTPEQLDQEIIKDEGF